MIHAAGPGPLTTLAVAALIAFFAVSCRREQVFAAGPAFVRERVTVAEAVRETVSPEYRSFGTAVFRSRTGVVSMVEGIIRSIHAEEGEQVRSGQLLAVLDRQQLSIRKREAEASLAAMEASVLLAERKLEDGARAVEAELIRIDNAEAELERKSMELQRIEAMFEKQERLFEVDGITREQLEEVGAAVRNARTDLVHARGELAIRRIGYRDADIEKAGYPVPSEEKKRTALIVFLNTRTLRVELSAAEARRLAAESELETIELLLSGTEVRSPVSGVVAGLHLHVGEKADPGHPILTIISVEDMLVETAVSEQDIGAIRSGQEAEIRTGFPDTVYRGTVSMIAPMADPGNRTTTVRIALEHGTGLRPGTFVRLVIRTGLPVQRILIPTDALVELPDNGHELYLFRSDSLFRVPVIPGESYGDRTVIPEGIEEGDLVARNPLPSWIDGMEAEIDR